MIPAFRFGLGAVLGTGNQRMPWIHLVDATGLVLHALDSPAMDGPVNVVAPQAVTNREFVRTLAEAVGRRVHFRAPAWGLRLALGQMSEIMLHSQYVVPKCALDSGYQFSFPNLAGCLKDVLAAM
jgi:NAD dependent epimerase/dehydratase family enzyme